MGRLLAALIAEFEPVPAANLAKPANVPAPDPERFADSQDSQGAERASATDQPHLPTFRAHLRDLAKAEGRAPTLIDRLPVADLPEYAGMNDAQLSALLSMLSDDADREAGRVPTGDTAAILCRSCGPVWVHPSVASVLPVVDQYARALGCPWCFIRRRGIAIPRPHVRCRDCRHRIPDTINPAQGMGRCAAGNESATWPGMRHRCADFRPMEGTP
jgi:hypothetical protein